MIDLSIILVNWNCLEYTKACLQSIQETVQGISYEIIVVDNDSADAPCQSLVDQFPAATLILSRDNIGFGPANNLAVLRSSGRTLFFLNPDTIVSPGAIHAMLNALDATPQCGAIGCKLLNPDGTLQNTCVQPFPTFANQLLALNWLQQRMPALPLWGRQALYSRSDNPVHEVDVVSGAAIMVKRDVFETVGGFHASYFMFAEEVDLCLTIHHAGYKVCHISTAEITHFGGQSTKNCEDSFAAVIMRDSVYRFFVRHRGKTYASLYRSALLASALLRIFLLTFVFLFSILSSSTTKRQSVAQTMRKWKKIAVWSLGSDAPMQRPPRSPAPTPAPR